MTILARGELKDGSAYEGKYTCVSTIILTRGGLKAYGMESSFIT
jgi:hypothetical protein